MNTRSNPLRDALREIGLTVEQAAALTGYSASYFAMMVRTSSLMTGPARARLAAALGLERRQIDDLIEQAKRAPTGLL